MASQAPNYDLPPPEAVGAAYEMSGALVDDNRPRLKGRRRLLNGLQRMASSPALVRVGRGRSASLGSRRLGNSSMSCVSLSSTASPRHCWDDPSSSRGYGGWATKPTTPTGLPGDTDEQNEPVRIVGPGITLRKSSVPIPVDIRPSSSGLRLESTEELKCAAGKSGTATPAHQRKVDRWSTLPMEAKIEILQYLGPKELVRCSLVSKSWHQMCFDGQLWARLDTSAFYRDISRDALLKVITAAGPFLRDLNLRGCVQLFRSWCWDGQQITDACCNLLNLNLEDCLLDKTTVHHFFLRNRSLVHINMGGVSTVSNSAMKIISKSCPNLEFLNVSWCKAVDTSGLTWVVKSCHNLRDLRISRMDGLDDDQFMLGLFDANTLERLVMSNCLSLTDTSLSTLLYGIDPEIDILTDRPMVPPRKLKHLDISYCCDLTDTGIRKLAHFVPDLEGLQLSFCSNVTNESLEEVVKTTPRLTHLDLEELGELTNDFLIALSKAPCAPQLRHLNLSYCEELGDTGMLPLMCQTSSIRSLDLDNTRVSDLTLMGICTQMKSRGASTALPKVGLRLAVFDCGNVTWTGIREVLLYNRSVPRGVPYPTVPNSPHESSTSLSSSSSNTTYASASSTPPPTNTSVSNPPSPPRQYPSEIIRLKCFHGWQMTTDEHTKRVLRGNLAAAARLERKWADYMMANEEAGPDSSARRRRRRRRDMDALEDEQDYWYGPGGLAPLGRRRARSGGSSCVVM